MANQFQTSDRASSLESLVIYILIVGMVIGALFLITNKESKTTTAEPKDRTLILEDE